MNATFNIALYKLLADWNPMSLEGDAADQEIYDCMDIIHQKLNEEETIQRIQAVYEFSFDTHPSAESVRKILREVELLSATCDI